MLALFVVFVAVRSLQCCRRERLVQMMQGNLEMLAGDAGDAAADPYR